MKRWQGWIVGAFCVIVLCTVSILSFAALTRPTVIEETVAPTATMSDFELDVRAVALIATFEAQVFPEPLRSDAYRAVAWTMRNRVDSHYNGVSGYRDEALLTKYSSFNSHRDDEPDSHAIEIAVEVLTAPDSTGDPTMGARHFVDNSYWTGTHEQRNSPRVFPWAPNDVDVRRLVQSGRFVLAIEWKTDTDHPMGPQFYGLYFFDYWPPPAVPTPTSTATPTRTPTSTRTMTPTRTTTPTRTRVPSRTPTVLKTVTPTLAPLPTRTLPIPE